MMNPPSKGGYEVYNQFTEIFSVKELAEVVQTEAIKLGHEVNIDHILNPRVEKEEHYYNAKCSKFLSLGLKPSLISDTLINHILHIISKYKDRINNDTIYPHINWK